MNLEVNYYYDEWLYKLDKTVIEKAVKLTINEVIPNMHNIELSLSLANDKFVRTLNNKYRDNNNFTNVLSFPQYDSLQDVKHSNDNVILLGDIVLAYEIIYEESKLFRKTFQEHAIHLIIHGVLHLLNFDHVNLNEEKKMKKIEIFVLSKMNIANPYVV